MAKNEDFETSEKEFVLEAVRNGEYFKDSFEWYLSKYMLPLSERSLLMFLSIFGWFLFFVIAIMVTELFPLVHQAPIVTNAKDVTSDISIAVKIKDPSLTIEQSVVKYLITQYIENREEFDFARKDAAAEYEKKIIWVKNNSSNSVFGTFKSNIEKQNYAELLGFEIKRQIKIDRFEFKANKTHKTIMDNATSFFNIDNTPKKANIYGRYITINNSEESSTKFSIEIDFDFSGIKFKDSGNFDDIKFLVTNYKISLIK